MCKNTMGMSKSNSKKISKAKAQLFFPGGKYNWSYAICLIARVVFSLDTYISIILKQ